MTIDMKSESVRPLTKVIFFFFFIFEKISFFPVVKA